MNTLPFVLVTKFYPKGPESVKNIFPFLFESAIELGPSRGTPSYSLTNSASDRSPEFIAITDCFKRSVT